MNEAQLQRILIERCRGYGVLAFKMECKGRRGFPDLLLLHNGVSVFIEVKNPKGTGRLSAWQKKTIKLLTENGAHAYVIESEAELYPILRHAYGIAAGRD